MYQTKYFSINITIIALTIAGLIFSSPGFAEAKTSAASKAAKAARGLGDANFVNVNAMGVTQIQNILSANGSFLKDFSEGGRTAAQIIRDAANGHGDASSTMYGIKVTKTVNPAAILATLQKEQSLVTMRTKNDGALNAAMGYGCPDSGGCNEKYKGFTKQVENGAWQLRYNYERAKGYGFKDYQVGQTIKLDGKKVKITSRSQSALYRYTPHYSSNFNSFFARYNPATATGSTVATSSRNYTGVKCATLGSKSLRRECTIYQAKNPSTVAAPATVTSATTTTAAQKTIADCDKLTSKSARRICKWNLPK